jgi:glycosyltransferase involved in cell wall biosynthesis
LATWNGEAYLGGLLESIAEQDRLPWELVVSDDASEDGTAAVLESFAARSPFPVMLERNEKRLGLAGNFERVIARASGDVIFPCDQDDIWLPRKVSRILSEFERRPEVVGVYSDSSLIDASGHQLSGTFWSSNACREVDRSSLEAGRGLVQLAMRPWIAGHALAFRASARDLILPLSRSCAHDAWITRLLAATSGLTAIEEILVEYRVHDTNTVGLNRGPRPAFGRASWNLPEPWAREAAATEELISRLHERCPGVLRTEDEAILRDRVAHLEKRRHLPSVRLRRLGPIRAEIRSGRYSRYSNGFRSAAADLLKHVD